MYLIDLIGGCLIMSIGMLFSLINLVNKRIKNINKIVFIIVLTLLMIFSRTKLDGFERVTFNIFTFNLICYLLILNRNITKTIYYSIVIYTLSIFIEIFLSIIFTYLFDFNMDKYNSFSLSLLFFSVVSSIIMFVITKLNVSKKVITKIEPKNNKFYIYLSFSIIVLSVIITQNKVLLSIKDNNYIYMNALLYLFVVFCCVFVIYNNYKKYKLEERYNQTLEYLTEYESIIDEQGKKNHEYNNQLMILNGYIDNKKKLKEYLSTIIDDYRTGQNYEIRQLSHFPNGGFKGLLYFKISKMKENNIKYFIYVPTEIKKYFENFDLKLYKDITKIFGVIIDNAIDAAKDSIEKEIVLDFKVEEKYIIITITNTFNTESDISKIGKKGFTTKGKGHGYGLSIVKDLVRSNEKIEVVTEKTRKEFSQTILIDIK